MLTGTGEPCSDGNRHPEGRELLVLIASFSLVRACLRGHALTWRHRMKITVTIVAFILIAIACNDNDPITTTADDQSAEALLEQVTAAYARLPAYQDTGTVKVFLENGAVTDLAFSTAFLRPSRIRFKLLKYPGATHEYDIWTDTDYGRLASPNQPVSAHPTPFDALSRVAGLSGGASVLVPKLLLTRVSGWRLRDLQQPTLRSDQPVYYEVSGKTTSGANVQLRIRRSDLMILEFRETNPTGNLLRSIEYEPQSAGLVNSDQFNLFLERAP